MVKVIDQSCCFMKLFKNLRHCLKSIRKTLRHSFDSTMCRLSSPQPNIQVNSLTAALPFSNFISSSKKLITKSLLRTLVDSNSVSIELKRFEAIEVLSLLILISSMESPLDFTAAKNGLTENSAENSFSISRSREFLLT